MVVTLMTGVFVVNVVVVVVVVVVAVVRAELGSFIVSIKCSLLISPEPATPLGNQCMRVRTGDGDLNRPR